MRPSGRGRRRRYTRVYGSVLENLAPRVADRIARIPGVVNVQDGIVPVGGNVATSVRRGDKMVDVRVWIPERVRDNVRDLGDLLIHAPDGHAFPVRRAAAVMLVFLVLVFLYERFRVALATLVTTALALAAVNVGLWVTGTEMNIASMMGLTMIVGIVTEVSIFYVTEVREQSQEPDRLSRLLVAGCNRMRPIAMTTLAAILALAPLALGIGHGSGMLRPLAIAIEAGLIAQMPLTLLVLPVLLKLMRSDPSA